jgi:hypothetical protein
MHNKQDRELSENSLILEIFIATSEKIRQVFLLNAYAFRDFLIFQLNFQRFFRHCVLHPDKAGRRLSLYIVWLNAKLFSLKKKRSECQIKSQYCLSCVDLNIFCYKNKC